MADKLFYLTIIFTLEDRPMLFLVIIHENVFYMFIKNLNSELQSDAAQTLLSGK